MSQDTYDNTFRLAAPAAEVFAFFERPDAFDLLSPPWAKVEILEQEGTIRNGDRKKLKLSLGPLHRIWELVHRDYLAGEQFKDVQKTGPFSHWEHTHRVEPDGDGCQVVDHIEFALPGGFVGGMLGGSFVKSQLDKLFVFREQVLRQHFENAQSELDR
ncbi:SRPBCC family protein [Lignipirellula cremea]|uniref:Polyketide cyclase / dehydrase and lipid transport n=1 Tax=Lignipirellula cremea TaxID=2528010 RepID=A0A518E2X5_9BACT|nr:SRPBCC family protein [Lignipirellula cremea]QDU98413.1 Polyketide cyclase / dehydrase and lipid transport [Lignipirellula cremea]